jgi:hypothetical protein
MLLTRKEKSDKIGTMIQLMHTHQAHKLVDYHLSRLILISTTQHKGPIGEGREKNNSEHTACPCKLARELASASHGSFQVHSKIAQLI